MAKLASAHWRLMPISREIVDRARQPFPGEPIRSLDAIHLASALLAADSLPDFALLSLDRRVRAAGSHLGLRVLSGSVSYPSARDVRTRRTQTRTICRRYSALPIRSEIGSVSSAAASAAARIVAASTRAPRRMASAPLALIAEDATAPSPMRTSRQRPADASITRSAATPTRGLSSAERGQNLT